MSRLDRFASKGAGSLAVFAALVLAGCVSKACPDGQSFTNGKCVHKSGAAKHVPDAGANGHADAAPGDAESSDAGIDGAVEDAAVAPVCDPMKSAGCWLDNDHDGFAAAGAAVMSGCFSKCPDGWTARPPAGDDVDCKEGDAQVYPRHCWKDADMDGFAVDSHDDRVFCGKSCGTAWTATEPTGAAIDCDVSTAATSPGASEICDGRDQDCDGKADEGADSSCTFDNASGKCTHGQCALSACQRGFGNCDGMHLNGCEQALDANGYCGACGLFCDVLATCARTKVKNVSACACTAPSFGDGVVCHGPGPIAVGTDLTCLIDASDSVSCLGRQDSPVVTQLRKGTMYRQLSISQSSLGCGITLDGHLDCWAGANIVPGNTKFIQVVSGYESLCGLTEAHTPICWAFGGKAQYGEAGPPEDQFVQLAEGWYHVCGLRADGTVLCWGAGSFARPNHCVAGTGSSDPLVDCGQGQPPPDKFVQITAGMLHTCGLKEDGSVVCWGVGVSTGMDRAVYDFGQSKPPADKMVWISAGTLHTCGLREDGTAVCWGAGKQGQTTEFDKLQSDPPNDSFLVLAASEYHTCGLTKGNHLVCWGNNTDGRAPPVSDGIRYPLNPGL